MTKAEFLRTLADLYSLMNSADHENKRADWLTPDMAGKCGCAALDNIMRSEAFTDDERQAFLDNIY